MRRCWSKQSKSQRGFTLPEILVVVALLGILAAVAVPNVGRFVGSGQAKANATELQSMQTAMDLYMSEQGVTTVAAQAVASNDLTATTPVLAPNYVRVNPTRCSYTWDAAGAITQGTCP